MIKKWNQSEWPETLFEIPQSPKQLFIRGNSPDNSLIKLCVVGSRKNSDYGRKVCEKLISGLSGYPVSIISGLAFGMDSIAHESALENNLETIAVLGSGLSDESIYPQAHLNLAEKIIQNNGCLISEYEHDFKNTKWSFPRRNRIMVGLSEATLIIEANEKSGSMITARLTVDYNHDLLTVPGSIFDPGSFGPNSLIREGAVPITSSNDILEILGIEIKNKSVPKKVLDDLSDLEKVVYKSLTKPISKDELAFKNKLSISELNEVLTMLEIKGLVEFINGKICQK